MSQKARNPILRNLMVLSGVFVCLAPSLLAEWVPTTRRGERVPVNLGVAAVECKGNEVLSLDGQTVEADGIAILASGNCRLELNNVQVKSLEGFALVVRGKADVTIRDSRLEGAKGAVGMSGTGQIDASYSQFWGGFVRDGDGDLFVEDGSNGFWPKTEMEIVIKGP